MHVVPLPNLPPLTEAETLAGSVDAASDATGIDVFVARQPIFRRNRQVYGYELLYRTGSTNSFDGTAADVDDFEDAKCRKFQKAQQRSIT